jgi:hypothetical protein
MCFVAVNQQPLSDKELVELLEKFSTPRSYYFLRWKHRVGGFWERRKDEYKSLEDDIRDRITSLNNPSPENPPTETFPSPEGQLFNSILEIRWKQQKGGYQVLILSSQNQQSIFTYQDKQLFLQLEEKKITFKIVKENWEVLEQNTLTHSPTETRFPKNLPQSVNDEKVNIAQRYFRDKNTATVHFVALTVRD